MMTMPGRHGPTLAELNTVMELEDASSVMDDISSVITKDLTESVMPNMTSLNLDTPASMTPSAATMSQTMDLQHALLQTVRSVSKPVPIPSAAAGAGHVAAGHAPTPPKLPCATVTSPDQLLAITGSGDVTLATAMSAPPAVHRPQLHTMTSIPVTVFQQQMPLQTPQQPLSSQNLCNILPPVENNKPRPQPVDWSYPGELLASMTTVADDKPSLLRLLASSAELTDTSKPGGNTVLAVTRRRPLHVPKRTRGLSESSGLQQLQVEGHVRGLKRPGLASADDSDSSNASAGSNSLNMKWKDIKKLIDISQPPTAMGGTAAAAAVGTSSSLSSSFVVGTPPKKIKVELTGAQSYYDHVFV